MLVDTTGQPWYTFFRKAIGKYDLGGERAFLSKARFGLAAVFLTIKEALQMPGSELAHYGLMDCPKKEFG